MPKVFARVGYRPYTQEEIDAIKAAGRITPAAKWDCATPEERKLLNPLLNPNKRWYEQKAWRVRIEDPA